MTDTVKRWSVSYGDWQVDPGGNVVDYDEHARVVSDLAAEVLRIREALAHLVPATDELLNACEKSGAFDNLVPQLFPGSKRRGVRRDDGYAEIDKARSNVRAWLSVARAALEGRE